MRITSNESKMQLSSRKQQYHMIPLLSEGGTYLGTRAREIQSLPVYILMEYYIFFRLLQVLLILKHLFCFPGNKITSLGRDNQVEVIWYIGQSQTFKTTKSLAKLSQIRILRQILTLRAPIMFTMAPQLLQTTMTLLSNFSN